MEIKRFGRIGVLMGGPSSEKKISLKSGRAVLAALRDAKIDAVSVIIEGDGFKENASLLKSKGIDNH